jgi:hypothetical protein
VIEQLLQADRLLTVDQVEQARGVYAHVVALDPGNAIAVVGLARCALAEGDDRAAHDLASRALRIDPENDMARRMEARLAEILATRGQSVERPDVGDAGAAALRPLVTDGRVGSLATADAPPPGSGGATAGPQPADRDAAALPDPSLVPAARRSLLDRLRGRG